MPSRAQIKCLVWDLDGTVWGDVAVELPAGSRPRTHPEALRTMALLEDRGIVNSVASRTDPSVAALLAADPVLAGRFVAPQVGWEDKSGAIRRIAKELGIAPAAVAFVDDDPFERAEVAAMLPDVLVLSPDELYGMLDTPFFQPAVITEDGRRRAERYREEQHRRAAMEAFRGSREEFLRSCQMRLRVGHATPGDLDRLAELASRTHRFNSTGVPWTRERLAQVVADDRWFVPVARLADRFGDYGLIGAALIERGSDGTPAWRLHLYMVSCRAVGRGIPAEFLGWIIARARDDGAGQLLMDVRPNEANIDLRVLLRRAGFQATAGGAAAGIVVAHPLTEEPPGAAGWLTVIDD